MKSINVRRVGSLVAGTAMLGAALSAPVMAGLDSTGITKGFFYDASYNPIVQIVVGEKGMATDAVAAGNIAATIGNLAYMTQTVTGTGPSYTPEGQVVITTAARGAIGDYVQDTQNHEDILDFYNSDTGLYFQDSKTYEKGDFTSYTLSCDKQTRTEAGILMEGSYTNIHCLFCHNLCLEALENPSHDMKEKISINSSKINYYEDGLGDDKSESLKMAIERGAVSYQVETDYIPMKRIVKDDCSSSNSEDCYVDFEYRGKMILFGEEYYVKDVEGSDKIYLAKAKVLDDVTSEGFTSEYNGYKFKVDHLIYAAEYTVAGILLDVQKPDGTIVQVQISKMANGVVDNLELSGVYAEEAAALQTASIIVYDLSSQVLLQDGEDLEIGGQVKTDWEVEFATIDNCQDSDTASDGSVNDCDKSEYDGMATDDASLLKSVTVTYNHDLDGDEALEQDESLNFPNNFRLTFKGYQTSKFKTSDITGQDKGGILLERGDENYQAVLTLTGSDDNTYSKVRLDEGPFKKNQLFMLDGVVYQYADYTKNDNGAGTTDNTVDVTLDPQIRGNRQKIKDLQRYCDDKDDGDPNGLTYTGANCADLSDIKLRELALYQALKVDAIGQATVTSSDYDKDNQIELDPQSIFVKKRAISLGGGKYLDLVFDASDNSILFTTNMDYNGATKDFTDSLIYINQDMVGTFDDFQVDGYNLDFKVVNEADLTVDPNAVAYNVSKDTNLDGDDDDTLFVFGVSDGNVVIDMSDRAYNKDVDTDYHTDMYLDTDGDLTKDADDIELNQDTDTLLITPKGGDKFTVDYGADNRIDSVAVAHPQERVYSTYFIGTVEEQTTAESTITKADEGKDVSAGCCTFTISKFDVTVGNQTSGSTTTSVVNPVVGNMVVPEVAADTTKNLILVGGPAVNAMTESAGVSADDISAASDKYVVEKSGNMVVVAGWTADDTVAAGNALINWLKANVHA